MMFDVYVYPPIEWHFIEDQTRGMNLPSNLGCSPARVTMPIPNHRRKSELHSRTAPPLDEVTGLIEQTITNQLDGWNCPEVAISQWRATPWFEHGSTLVQPYRWIDLDDSRNHDCHDSSGACTVCVANPWIYERYCERCLTAPTVNSPLQYVCGDKPAWNRRLVSRGCTVVSPKPEGNKSHPRQYCMLIFTWISWHLDTFGTNMTH